MKGQIVLNQKTAAASQIVLVSLHCWDMKYEMLLATEKNVPLKLFKMLSVDNCFIEELLSCMHKVYSVNVLTT